MTGRATRERVGLATAVAGGVGLLLWIAGLFFTPQAALAAWLPMALFLLGLPLGAMTVLMIHLMTGGKWGLAVRGPLRTIVAMTPVALILMLPVLAGAAFIFPWAGDNPMPEIVNQKLAYLNLPFFYVRFLFCAAIWLVLAWFVLGWTSGTAETEPRSSRGPAIGLVAHGLAVTIFSIDWMMSLEPDFYSTIYGMLEASGQVVGAYALSLIVIAATKAIEARPGGDEGVALSEDVSNMLFGFVLMWAYLAFMQWLIVWAADLPIEIHWYLLRAQDGWQFVLWLLIATHFAVPFGGFLARSLKRSHAGILTLGGVVFFGHFVDVFWRVRPPLVSGEGPLQWLDIAALAGAGGVWTWLLIYALSHPEWLARWRGRFAHG